MSTISVTNSMAKKKIDWSRWNTVRKFFDTGAIMAGEEKQLTDQEIDDVNRYLEEAEKVTGSCRVLLEEAVQRFKNRKR